MPSALYNRLLETMSPYVGAANAKAMMQRQLDRTKSTPESFSTSDLQKISMFLEAAATLYIADKPKQGELTTKLRAIR